MSTVESQQGGVEGSSDTVSTVYFGSVSVCVTDREGGSLPVFMCKCCACLCGGSVACFSVHLMAGYYLSTSVCGYVC